MNLGKTITIIIRLIAPILTLFILLLLFIYHFDSKQKAAISRAHLDASEQLSNRAIRKNSPVKIGLALGGGGAKGFAHIGVIKVLQENHIPIDVVTGTSAGSVVGVLYAYGFSAYGLQRILKDVGFSLMDFGFSFNGFIRGKKIRELINKNIHYLPMEKLPIKFGAVATEFGSGKATLFIKGDAGQAVQASSSIPAIFQPTIIRGHMYVDGELSEPIPVKQARKLGAKIVIAIDISSSVQPPGSFYQPNSWFSTIDQSVNILINKLVQEESKQADVVIRPNLEGASFFNFFSMSSAIHAGEEATRRKLPQIKAAIRQAQYRY